jgi:hypothetical protein
MVKRPTAPILGLHHRRVSMARHCGAAAAAANSRHERRLDKNHRPGQVRDDGLEEVPTCTLTQSRS